MMIISFAYQKTFVLLERKDVDVLSTVNDMFFTYDDEFNSKNGFNFAVAFTEYGND